jgi:hypothetical protein
MSQSSSKMDCEECKSLISVFLDNELDEIRAGAVRTHLAACGPCALVFEDFASILDVCKVEAPAELAPPNSQALWCRINNIIESEIKVEPAAPPEVPAGRFWRLSLGQLSAAVVLVAIVSSLVTVTAVRSFSRSEPEDYSIRTSSSQTTFEKVLSKVGLIDTPQQARERRLQQQQAAIEYWNARVQSKRGQWDRATREAFDRNLKVIDDSVNDYKVILQRDPDDELSGEMLDSVLNDKMALLRDFSEL